MIFDMNRRSPLRIGYISGLIYMLLLRVRKNQSPWSANGLGIMFRSPVISTTAPSAHLPSMRFANAFGQKNGF